MVPGDGRLLRDDAPPLSAVSHAIRQPHEHFASDAAKHLLRPTQYELARPGQFCLQHFVCLFVCKRADVSFAGMTTAPSCAIPMRFDVENSSTNLRSTADAHVSSVQVPQLPVQRRAVASRNLAKRNTKHAHTGPLKQTHADAFSHAQARTQLRKHLHADSAAVRWLPMRYKLELRVASRIECERLDLPRRAAGSSAVGTLRTVDRSDAPASR